MKKMYDISFEVATVDVNQSFLPAFKTAKKFSAYSDEGIYMLGECDWKGNVISESYIHYYYSECMNNEIENILGSCFENFYVVRDCLEFNGNDVLADLVNVNSLLSEEDYISHIDKRKTYFRVYLKDSVTEEQLHNALDILQKKEYLGNVYFMPIKPELLEELKSTHMSCYYAKSSVSEMVSKSVKSVEKQEVDELIYNPFIFVKAQYVPKYDLIEIIK